MRKMGICFVLLILALATYATAQKNENIDVTTDIQAQASAKASMEECIKFLSERYPNANTERLNAICAKIKSRTVSANSQANGTAMQNRIRALENLNEMQKEKIMGMSQDLKNKFTNLNQDKLKEIAQLSPEEIQKVKALGKSKLESIAKKGNLSKELAKMRLDKVKAEDLYKKRNLTKEEVKSAKEKFDDAKEKYDDTKANFTKEKEAFLNAIGKKDDAKALTHAKNLLSKGADLVIRSLEKIKSSIQENDDLTEEEAATMIDDIDARIAAMQAAKAKVEAATTKDEVKEAGKEIISEWEAMKDRIRLHAGRILKSKVQEVLKRSEQLEVRVEKVIAKLEESGTDTTQLKELSDQFSGHIADAREHFKQAGDKFAKASALKESNTTQEEISTLISGGKDLLSQAHEDLKAAHNVLKEILAKVREAKGDINELEEEGEVTVAEDTDEGNDTVSEDNDSDGTELPDGDETVTTIGQEIPDGDTTTIADEGEHTEPSAGGTGDGQA